MSTAYYLIFERERENPKWTLLRGSMMRAQSNLWAAGYTNQTGRQTAVRRVDLPDGEFKAECSMLSEEDDK